MEESQCEEKTKYCQFNCFFSLLGKLHIFNVIVSLKCNYFTKHIYLFVESIFINRVKEFLLIIMIFFVIFFKSLLFLVELFILIYLVI